MANGHALMRCLPQSLMWLRGMKCTRILAQKAAHHDIGNVMTDDWPPDQRFIPPERHTQSNAQTFTVEGYHSLFRHCLVRVLKVAKWPKR